MGLSIHYRFHFHGSEAELLNKLKRLSTEFLKLPVSKVHPIESGEHGYELPVDIGPGCEWFVVTLARDAEGEWHGRGFTKTAFAADMRGCHTTVVEMLDLCKEAGVLESVEDESGYWAKRDPGVFQ